MASPGVLAGLKAALAYDDADRQALAQSFLDHKIAVYIDTLGQLADDYGYDYGGRIDLSDEVLQALAQEAAAHAASVVDTFNSEVDKLVDRNAGLNRDAIIDLYEQWVEARADSHAPIIAVTEAYSAHADATASFWAAAGLEPQFDFGPHAVGEDHAECSICQALEDLSPHPLSRVIEVGMPHVNCRQSWAEDGVDESQLPDELQLGATPGGIVGTDPLVQRHGNDRDAATAAVHGLVAGGTGTLGQ